MRTDWLTALHRNLAAGRDAVLITVAGTQGSAPRDGGATMVVDRDDQAETIGGGHLEWQAVAHARRLLETGSTRPEVRRYNLGARLGQCCGGVVWLLFEVVPASAEADWRQRCEQIAAGHGLLRKTSIFARTSTWTASATGEAGCQLLGGPEDWLFEQTIAAQRFPVWVFGAGHVARALVRQLQPLGAAITWIDSRDDAFAGIDSTGLNCLVTDLPEAEVARAPAGAYFVVMTHSHALDFALCEAIYQRQDFAYFGLIGSRSKRMSFEHRLLERGVIPDRLAEMTCPIGVAGIVGKEPAVIALAVAAQLMQIHDTRQLLAQAARPRLAELPVRPLQPE